MSWEPRPGLVAARVDRAVTLPFRVLLITDAAACARAGRGVMETVTRALDHDAREVSVLVRMKAASVDDVARTCEAVRAIAARAGALVFVHTHAHLVARLGLAGVHLDGRARVDEARVALPPGALLGVSRHAQDPLSAAALRHADYVALAPVFAPRSKPGDARAPLGLDVLARAASSSARPIVALGGVDDLSARACFAHGAAAVAVVGAVMSAREPGRALAALLVAAGARTA